MMNKIVVIIPYFGKLKPSFRLWYESAKRNKDIDFLLFINDHFEKIEQTDNIKVVYSSLADINALANRKLGFSVFIKHAYKLCDFKPMYGLIFEDYIQGYEYWGYGDLDVIYGDINNYLENINYRDYTKINAAGHFCLIKNNERINKIFLLDTGKDIDYRTIVSDSDNNYAFDEKYFNSIFMLQNEKIYDGTLAADIIYEHGKMKIVCGEYFNDVFWLKQQFDKRINYKKQYFFVKNGKIIRVYTRRFKVYSDEFCYIHFRREMPIIHNSLKTDQSDVLISHNPDGFFPIRKVKIHGILSFWLFEIKLKLINLSTKIYKYYSNRL